MYAPTIIDYKKILQDGLNAWENDLYDDATNLFAQFFAETEQSRHLETVSNQRLTIFAPYGKSLTILGKPQESLTLLYQYLNEAGNNIIHAIDAIVLISQTLNHLGYHEEAFLTIEDAFAAAKTNDYKRGQALSLSLFGTYYDHQGRLEESTASLKKAYHLFTELQDTEGIIRSLNSLGITHFYRGQIDRSIDLFSQALESARQFNLRATTIGLSNLGECYQKLYDFETALPYHKEAIELAEKLNLPTTKADACRNLGIDLYYLGKPEAGILYLNESLMIAETYGLHDIQIQAYYSMAMAKLESGQIKQAFKYAELLRQYSESNNARTHMTNAMHILGLCYEADDNREGAEQMWQKGLFLAHETNQKMRLWQIHACLARMAPNPVLGGIHYRIATEVINDIVKPIEAIELKNKFLQHKDVAYILEIGNRYL